MLDQTSTQTAAAPRAALRTYDLVVVGSGVAGLNALYAAVQYLPKGAPVLLVDQKDGAGGMWNVAYDYVRLHQPHPMFTVGDMKWGWSKPRDYLAKRDEVRDHLASALGPVSEAVSLETRFGQTMSGCEEVKTADGYRARVTFHPNDAPERKETVEAHRVIYAPGLNYRLAAPLKLSSDSVVSIIPQDLRQTLAEHRDAPLYVVGGGKTGMDTVLAALAENPDRKVSLIKGRGTNFFNRTEHIPTGLKRWTSGQLVSRVFRDMALNFDGDNEDHTIHHFRTTYSTDPDSMNEVFLYGLQSEEEHARIVGGLSDLFADYLADVTDGPDGPMMELRRGEKVPVAAGSIFVNCTGSFFRDALVDQLPIVSPHDTIVSINARDAFHFLTSVAGFFVTHLIYRNALRGRGFYSMDLERLFQHDRNAWIGASAAQAYNNQVVAVQTLPLTLLDRCGLDLDRWYPLPRRMFGLIQMKSSARPDLAHCRAALDRTAERFGIHCAPIP